MALAVIGAGLPRTGTHSLSVALQKLLGGRCYHMSAIPGHPFDLGSDWDCAIKGWMPDWDLVFDGYAAAVDWPTSLFWREISAAYPDAVVVLSVRDDAKTWYESFEETILPYIEMPLDPAWTEGRHLTDLAEKFVGSKKSNSPEALTAAYERHNEAVRSTIPPERLIEWEPSQGWWPLCTALGVAVPIEPFPWFNKREDWEQS